MKKLSYIFLLLFLFAFMGVNYILAAMTSNGGYQIWADDISIGGSDVSSSTSYQLSDSIGDAAATRNASDNYLGRIGFQEMLPDNSITILLDVDNLSFGTLNYSHAGTSTHLLAVAADAPAGFSVTYSGSTLTSGLNTITAIGSTATASNPGTKQFGLNAVFYYGDANAQAKAPYNEANKYAFHSGDEIIGAVSSISPYVIYSINYLANISADTPAGTYSSNITFTALPNF